jgi:threonine dehydrogenase-like Zn-dependent dehydrogenase
LNRIARVATITAPRRVAFERTVLREPEPGEVRVQVRGCGVCGSNVPVWQGRAWFAYPQAPGAPGHEAWGCVEAVGSETHGIGVGDPVALLSADAFADAVVTPAEQVVVLPEVLRDTTFPGEVLGCGFNIARRSRLEPGVVVAVVGIGFVGAIVTRLAAAAGARVIAISRRAASVVLAHSLGATETIVMDNNERIVATVSSLTDGALCDVVIEAVGAQWPLDLAGQLTGFGGRLVVAGYHQDGPRSVDVQLWNWRGIDVINAHERDPDLVRRGVREAAAAVADGWFDPAPLYTHTFELEQLGRALDAVVEHPDGFVKALVTM